MSDTFGGRTREKRYELGLSQKELAAKARIPLATLQRYERAETASIPPERGQAIADALGVNASYLFGFESREVSNNELQPLQVLLAQTGHKLEYNGDLDEYVLSSERDEVCLSAAKVAEWKKEVDSFASFLGFKALSEIEFEDTPVMEDE